MTLPLRCRNWISILGPQAATAGPGRPARPTLRWAKVLAIAIACALAVAGAQAQTFNVIYNFTGGADGSTPMAGLTLDPAGNLYGTANYGGNVGGNCGAAGCGTVFRLTNHNANWVFTPLYAFAGGNDGANPQAANVVIGPNGTLFSTTFLGGGVCDGNAQGCGTVFNLQPPPTTCRSSQCSWSESVLFRFSGENGSGPVGAVVFDSGGNLLGVTILGGLNHGGTVYQLNSGNWQESVLSHPYGYPGSGITLSNTGQLYGTTFSGGNNYGSVYELVQQGSEWVLNSLYKFTNGSDGGYPKGGVIFDPAGNLYGATSASGSGGGGTVFELSPSNGNWTYSTLYNFASAENGALVVGPVASLVMDTAGNLYGTTLVDGAHSYGAVFKLALVNGSWTYTSLHDFTNGSDGAYPFSNLVFDAQGNLYGTASAGGANGQGVVFQIAP